MKKATSTVNPLHFEDLEPHRFEDLVRQLIYDFREWRSLEATGRQGSEGGFDIRGWEVSPGAAVESGNDEEAEESEPEEDRIWLIQCKRVKSITPKKLVAYLGEINLKSGEPLHGLLLVAACDFSKKARDDFRDWCVKHGISEYYLWGRAEIEDLLFQPRYDYLLFAYFGISLQIRKRSARTRLRGLLSIKRQVIRYLGDVSHDAYRPVLLRDPDAKEYPYKDEVEDFDKRPRWRVYLFIGHYHSGLVFLIRTHFAYIDGDRLKWDVEERVKVDKPYDDPWAAEEDQYLAMKVRHFWSRLSVENQGTFEGLGYVPYEDILAIDEHGDEYFHDPHVYVRFDRHYGPFSGGHNWQIVRDNPTREFHYIRMEDRIDYFPEAYPEIENREDEG